MKDILVHLSDSERSSARLDVAIGLAQTHGARLTGLFARSDSHRPSSVARMASDSLAGVRAEVAALFDRRTKAAGIEGRWWQLAHGATDHVLNETMFCARYADLVVMGQPDENEKFVPKELVEHTLTHCGRPVLVIPCSGHFTSIGEKIALAWNASREAVRAMVDARPLMLRASSVTVLSLHGRGGRSVDMGEVPQVDIVDHLAAWAIRAEVERLTSEHVGTMDMLLSRLCDLGVDLLVMGAHGQINNPTLGAGTRHVLAHMTVPVLMSN